MFHRTTKLKTMAGYMQQTDLKLISTIYRTSTLPPLEEKRREMTAQQSQLNYLAIKYLFQATRSD